jgi:hypothetical protein
MRDNSAKTATELIRHSPPELRGRASIRNRLMAAIAACAVGVAPLRAADIRGNMENGVVLEGKIEVGDYIKLRSVYGERNTNQFYIGMPEANEIYLASPGGDLAEAMKIGRLVRALKLHTIIPSKLKYPLGPYERYSVADRHQLTNPKANYLCTSACFFIFVAGITRTDEVGFQDPRLGIHRPYLSEIDLSALSGDQAITSANRVRAAVENYLKEMNVPAKYVDLMFSIPKDKIQWVGKADFEADLEGTIPELNDWLAARCDKRTDVEKAVWEKLKADPRPLGQYSTAERSIADKMQKKMSQMHDCESDVLNKLSGSAWLQVFDPTCTAIAPEARTIAEGRTLCPRKN